MLSVILEPDLLCFTETQVLTEQNTDNIKDCMWDFVTLHNTPPYRFQIIAFCYKHGIDIVSHVKPTGISYIAFQKPLFNIHWRWYNYRKNNQMAFFFLNTMEQINRPNEVQIILEDFKINGGRVRGGC